MIRSKDGIAAAVGPGEKDGIAAAAGSETFTVSGHSASMLVQLQTVFGVTSNAEVIRKALALASLASQHAGADNTITISPDDGSKPPVRVHLDE
jgi:hypothetical protein